jgi:SET domain-containing protein
MKLNLKEEDELRKKEILKQLQEDIYCRVAPSKISGVGVVAIRDIPKGTNPFKEEDINYIPFSEEELKEIHPETLRLIKDLFVFADGFYWIPPQGIQTLSITHFLNHSSSPNITTDNDASEFFAIRDIKQGEELTVNYAIFDEADRDFD